MDLLQVTSTKFVLLRAEWPVDQARSLIDALHPIYLIVHRVLPGHAQEDLYYLLTVKETLDRFARRPGAPSVEIGLDLYETDAVPSCESSTNAESAPGRCIVMRDGALFGFFDENIRPTRGATRGAEQGPAAAPSRAVIAEFPDEVAVNDYATLLVSLSAEPAVTGGLPPAS